MDKKGRTVVGNKERIKKIAKILASSQTLTQAKDVIWQDSRVFLGVCPWRLGKSLRNPEKRQLHTIQTGGPVGWPARRLAIHKFCDSNAQVDEMYVGTKRQTYTKAQSLSSEVGGKWS